MTRPDAVCRLNRTTGLYEAKTPTGAVLFRSDSLQAVYNFLMGA